MKKGGTARSIRYLTIFCVVITLLFLGVIFKKKKESYTGLWEKVNNLEIRIKELER